MNRLSRRPRIDAAVSGALDELVRQVGGDPEQLEGKLVREIMHTALKLIPDKAHAGEMKLISRSLKELRYAMKVFRPFAQTRKISVFGSARTSPEHPHYRAAEHFSRVISSSGWMVITGAGDGIMRAGHDGAGREASFGVAIRLPFETNANEFISGDEKLILFRYFFTRKLMFVSQADAVALFPGGFGTHDEGFEVLTLIQTGKANMVPIIMIDAPGDNYWAEWDKYVHDHLLAKGMISEDDLNLYLVTDDTDKAVQHILQFYRNYHSQRFVRDHLVMRMHRPLRDSQLDALNEQFGILLADGRMVQGGPLHGEQTHLELPRISFHYNKHHFGTLRALIDQINRFDAENGKA